VTGWLFSGTGDAANLRVFVKEIDVAMLLPSVAFVVNAAGTTVVSCRTPLRQCRVMVSCSAGNTSHKYNKKDLSRHSEPVWPSGKTLGW